MKTPKHLDTVAAEKWKELAGQVDVSQPGTADALTAYCVAWSEWKGARAKVDELGTVVLSPAGFPAISPYVTVAAAAERRMRQWGKELGLVSRTKARPTPEATSPAPTVEEISILFAQEQLRRLAEGPGPAPRRRRNA